MNAVTAEDCEAFAGYIAKWQAILNLEDWRIYRGSRRPKGVFSTIVCDNDAKMATYQIGRDFGSEKVTPESLESTALHELLHVRLHKFKTEPTEGNEHEVVNLFEKLLMKAYK